MAGRGTVGRSNWDSDHAVRIKFKHVFVPTLPNRAWQIMVFHPDGWIFHSFSTDFYVVMLISKMSSSRLYARLLLFHLLFYNAEFDDSSILACFYRFL